MLRILGSSCVTNNYKLLELIKLIITYHGICNQSYCLYSDHKPILALLYALETSFLLARLKSFLISYKPDECSTGLENGEERSSISFAEEIF